MFLLVTYPLFAMWGATNFVRRKADLTFTEKICKETKTTGLSLIKFYLCNIVVVVVEYVALSQTSSVQSMMFPIKGLTAALDTRISIPPHCSRVYFEYTNCQILRFYIK